MTLKKVNPTTLITFLFILGTGLIRILTNLSSGLSPLSNFTPIGAMALFGGAYFTQSWKGFALPLLTLFVSDVVLSFTAFSQYRTGLLYGGWYWTYAAFALMTVVGRFIKTVHVPGVLLGSLACVLIHWIVTDLGVWLGGTMYPHTMSGYGLCLIAAIPFEWNFLAGTLLYSAILFGAFEWMKHRYPQFQLSVK